MASTPEQFEGFYLDKAKLILDPDPKARRPSQLETGDHWIVWLNAFQKRGLPGMGQSRQTTIFIEFAARPEPEQPIDLATAPLQATYEYGGQAAIYISRQITGSLVLHLGEGDTFIADLNATFSNPILGTGERQFKDEIVLQKHPHPDFSHVSP